MGAAVYPATGAVRPRVSPEPARKVPIAAARRGRLSAALRHDRARLRAGRNPRGPRAATGARGTGSGSVPLPCPRLRSCRDDPARDRGGLRPHRRRHGVARGRRAPGRMRARLPSFPGFCGKVAANAPWQVPGERDEGGPDRHRPRTRPFPRGPRWSVLRSPPTGSTRSSSPAPGIAESRTLDRKPDRRAAAGGAHARGAAQGLRAVPRSARSAAAGGTGARGALRSPARARRSSDPAPHRGAPARLRVSPSGPCSRAAAGGPGPVRGPRGGARRSARPARCAPLRSRARRTGHRQDRAHPRRRAPCRDRVPLRHRRFFAALGAATAGAFVRTCAAAGALPWRRLRSATSASPRRSGSPDGPRRRNRLCPSPAPLPAGPGDHPAFFPAGNALLTVRAHPPAPGWDPARR